MKRILLSLVFGGLFFATQTTLNAQTIYVKANASGTNDGTSWGDAFTSLSDAIGAATTGSQIWVAAGTYKSTLATANSSFSVAAGIELYGGFAGSETSLNQRNYLTNVTTLSGDLNSDDVATDLTANRSDNSWHVIIILPNNTAPTARAVVDGFTIRNGNTKTGTADPDATKRGGGIFVNGKATVRNCIFTENQALLGAGISTLGAGGAGLIADNCTFDKNLSSNSAAGIYLQSSNSASINRCIFRNNTTNRGTLYPNQCSNIVIDSCLFENNIVTIVPATEPGQWGAGLYNWQSSYTITNSVFKNNTAYNGAGMYNDGREGGDFFTVDNCTFEQNNVANYGGSAMFNYSTNFLIKNCTFRDNIAPSSASAIYSGGEAFSGGQVQNCLFEGGKAAFGGAIANFSSPGMLTLDGCTFRNNNAVTSGGAVANGFEAKTIVKNCHFESNTANFGGAIFVQNDLTELSVDSSFFEGNNSTSIGGAVYLSGGNTSSFTNSTFNINSSDNGAAIVISEDSLDLSTSIIDRCIFQENLGLVQAGAINIENADVTITNTLFAGNQVLGEGAGGAVLVNGFGGKTARLKAVNCTWGNNFGPLGSSLAQFEGDSGKAEVTLQNCIFASEIGENYAIEAGAPVVNSLGGNLSADASLMDYLTATNDLNSTDPLFADPAFFDFHLLPGSPAIDKGIAEGAPSIDLDGNPRVGPPDMGGYEWGTTATHAPVVYLPLSLLPNPAVDMVRATIENEWQGNVAAEVVDAAGRVVRHLSFEKTGEKLSIELRVADLPKGSYMVQVQMGAVRMTGGLIKM